MHAATGYFARQQFLATPRKIPLKDTNGMHLRDMQDMFWFMPMRHMQDKKFRRSKISINVIKIKICSYYRAGEHVLFAYLL